MTMSHLFYVLCECVDDGEIIVVLFLPILDACGPALPGCTVGWKHLAPRPGITLNPEILWQEV